MQQKAQETQMYENLLMQQKLHQWHPTTIGNPADAEMGDSIMESNF